jgi:hypothetical protein
LLWFESNGSQRHMRVTLSCLRLSPETVPIASRVSGSG